MSVSSVNLRKAAVLLMSLPQEQAAEVLRKLKPKQIEAVSIEIARLEHITGDEQEAIIFEFADANPNSLLGNAGGLELAKTLVQRALGKNAGDTLDNVQQSIERLPFGFLKKVDPQNLMTFVNDEHPQTIALILSHLPPSYGAEIIAGLSTERQLQVIRRVANMGQTSPEVIKQVEQGLESRMVNVMSQQYENAGGVPSVAEILNVTDRTTERTLLENLAQEDPDLVEEIRRLMFVFEDINKLSAKDVQTVLKNVESSQWAMALKGASEDLKEKILGNMSQRAAALLVEEMDYLGAVRLSEVESVQQQIVDIIRRLEDAGEISTHSDDSNEEFIE
jgi:flagellar motor switch protein FliG